MLNISIFHIAYSFILNSFCSFAVSNFKTTIMRKCSLRVLRARLLKKFNFRCYFIKKYNCLASNSELTEDVAVYCKSQGFDFLVLSNGLLMIK